MENKTVIVNIYNFIRMSHVEPSRFIPDDFETIRNQLITVKQYGFPGTYALKYDALMEPRYQTLLKEYLDETDEVSAWWEITEPLCRRAGVSFRDSRNDEEYDDRVDSAYSIGYSPEERTRIVDAYMADFYGVFGKNPQSIGAWVLDSVTMAYARERYGVEAAAICRDQIGVDGFTLWGGYPNGMYFPSRGNENLPAQTPENQLDMPVFRLLGPDPIYNFEAEVRPDIPGVFTMEPAWLVGRDPKWLGWYFHCLTEEDALGVGYVQVGQENNFLWENIHPGFTPQLEVLKKLQGEGKLRVETMADSARWFRRKYRITPPVTFQASRDWNESRNLSCQWYACANYRVGLLWEQGHLRIRDCFVYDEGYPSRYLDKAMTGTKSNFDALPILYPQLWMQAERPFIRLRDGQGKEPVGTVTYQALNDLAAMAELTTENGNIRIILMPDGIHVQGSCGVVFDTLPVYAGHDFAQLRMIHEGHPYALSVPRGTICRAGTDGVEILPEQGEIFLRFGREQWTDEIYAADYLWDPSEIDSYSSPAPKPKLSIPPFAPEMMPGDWLFAHGEKAQVSIISRDGGEVRYTLDGSEPNGQSARYREPLVFSKDTVLRAKAFLADGRVSETSRAEYRFCITDMELESPTELDKRPTFHGNGLSDLLSGRRGTLDYLDGTWRGTLQDLDITCSLRQPKTIRSIAVGFLSHHRSGIVYPESVELYIGPDKERLRLFAKKELPCEPAGREIEKRDIGFEVNETIGAFRYVTRRYERMPQWCTYRGTTAVFTMADSLLVAPEE